MDSRATSGKERSTLARRSFAISARFRRRVTPGYLSAGSWFLTPDRQSFSHKNDSQMIAPYEINQVADELCRHDDHCETPGPVSMPKPAYCSNYENRAE